MTKNSNTDEGRAAVWTSILAAARQLGKRAPLPASPRRLVIQLRQGSGEVPVYFIGCGIHEFNLVQSLAVDQPIYGVEIPLPAVWHSGAARHEIEGLPNLEQMVAPYVAAIMAHTSSSCCVLAGHSFGGVMAFEACRQLGLMNIQVKAVLLFNAAAVYPKSHEAAWEKLKEVWRDDQPSGGEDLATEPTGGRLARSLAIVRWLLAEERNNFGRLLMSAIARRPEELTTKLDDTGRSIAWPQIKYVYDNAMKSYRMSPIDCRGVLFRAESMLNASSRSLDIYLGWDGLFGKGLEVVSVPGDHLSMMQQPYVSVLASEIGKTLTRMSEKSDAAEISSE